ncbi:4343_t:CDS:2 [Scutellospora calospora]|uniref:4343_t:CDS:1 n=1 Tax=Scutellospora calospora TaxID=85575 RepID=A0ACA9L9M5_9GLOM|nr:4343_t:CDS:2 [Scutellospora calospora]
MVDSDGTPSISESRIIVLLIFIIIVIRVVSVFLQKQAQNVASILVKNVTIVVLGDIGRSPRMQYHALSFAQNGWKVDLVGYDVYTQLLFLYWILFARINSPNFILVQNPPSIPTLMIVQFVCWARQTNLIIDWHNFGYTILGIRLGQDTHAHLTVTAAMHRELMYKWEVQGAISTLYDRPQSHFKKLDLEEIHEFLTKFNLEEIISKQSIGANFLPPSSSTSTILTTKPSPTSPANYRSDRPILIVSSTSWTADEDFSILLNAAKRYDQVADKSSQNTFPKLIFIITGKGPLRDKYEREIRCADLGISLHKSSSGMDLPMKIVDIIGELVQHGKNGLIFKNEEELARQLIELFNDYPANASKIKLMRKHVDEFQKNRWDANWNRVVLPLLNI